ncbi:MAG: phosphatase PAP2 family protein, partial [Sphingopyxis sp.]
MRKSLIPLGGAMMLALAPAAHASDKGWDDAGSLARDALVVAAFGVPAAQGDWDGVLQAGGSVGVAGGLSYGLK